jgi:hypothetical protein
MLKTQVVDELESWGECMSVRVCVCVRMKTFRVMTLGRCFCMHARPRQHRSTCVPPAACHSHMALQGCM